MAATWTAGIQLVAQPLMDLRTYTFRHTEILSRIAAPNGVSIAPPDYWATALAVSPAAVATLDRYVFRTVAAFPPATAGRVFVNLWPPGVFDPVPPWAGLDAAWLTQTALELSEVHRWSRDARRRLAPYREAGGWIALDDVGAGRDGLALMAFWRPDVVKVDRTLVDRVCRSPGQAAVVRGLVSMAHELGALVVAEGVERADDAAWCADVGFDFGQGYLWARPAPWVADDRPISTQQGAM